MHGGSGGSTLAATVIIFIVATRFTFGGIFPAVLSGGFGGRRVRSLARQKNRAFHARCIRDSSRTVFLIPNLKSSRGICIPSGS